MKTTSCGKRRSRRRGLCNLVAQLVAVNVADERRHRDAEHDQEDHGTLEVEAQVELDRDAAAVVAHRRVRLAEEREPRIVLDEPAVERADPLCERVGRRLALRQDDLLDAPPLQALELRLGRVLRLLRREGVGDVNVGKLVDEALSAFGGGLDPAVNAAVARIRARVDERAALVAERVAE